MPTPDSQDSNLTALFYAEEQAIGELPGAPVWRELEPNGYSDMGADYKRTTRNTINSSRQRKKGTITDRDVTAGYSQDVVLSDEHMRLHQSFYFAATREKADTQNIGNVVVPITSVTGATHKFNAAAGLGVFKVNDLIFASGFASATNNGLFVATAVAAGSVTLGAGLVDEAAPPSAARLQCVGVQFAVGDVTIAAAADGVTMGSTLYDFTTLGLNVGEWVFLGGDAAGTRFDNNEPGYARVASVAAHAIMFDDTTFAPANDAAAGKTIRMFFGKMLKNELGANIVKKSIQFERQLGDDGNGTQAEYIAGNVGNELKLTLPEADKLTVDLSFVGIGVEYNDGLEGIKAGARVSALGAEAFNSTHDMYRVKLAVLTPGTINPSGLVGYIDSGDLSIANGVKVKKALGVFGGFGVNVGDFVVSGSLSAYFTTLEAVKAVRDNADLGFNAIVAKGNKGFVYDIPCLNISGGRPNIQKDESIMLPLTSDAYENPNGYTLAYCYFPYLPDAAMPA